MAVAEPGGDAFDLFDEGVEVFDRPQLVMPVLCQARMAWRHWVRVQAMPRTSGPLAWRHSSMKPVEAPAGDLLVAPEGV